MIRSIVTVITPCAPHHLKLVARARRSVRAQTIPCEHLIRVDEAGVGPARLRREMTRAAQTPFVIYLDADDELEPTFVERTLPHVSATRYVYTSWYAGARWRVVHPPDPCGIWRNGSYHLVTTLLTREMALLGEWDEALAACEDVNFYLSLHAAGFCGVRVAEPLLTYHAGGGRSAALYNTPEEREILARIHARYGRVNMACCGSSNEAPTQPQGEKREGDVLARANWAGNRVYIGRVSKRNYGYIGNQQLIWVDESDLVDRALVRASRELVVARAETMADLAARLFASPAPNAGVVGRDQTRAWVVERLKQRLPARPIVSVVTGTYNRLALLERMVESVRAQKLPRYEIIIVDGGSTDGTLAWAHTQADVRVIEQGRLLGAIEAFNEGARASQGDYVLLANDDVEFAPFSIVRALTHLMDTPEAAAVNFQDGRDEGILVRTPQGVKQLPYARVALVRKALGEAVGWWGERGYTYGGDALMSARLYERGYRIDEVEGVYIVDHRHEDDLRVHNLTQERRTRNPYREVYNQPPVMGAPNAVPDEPILRVLYAPILSDDERAHKRGLRDALSKRAWVIEHDYLRAGYDLAAVARHFRPHLVLTQCHDVLLDLTWFRERTAALLVNWNGDVHERHLTSEAALSWARALDLALSVNASAVEAMRAEGVHAHYWQVAAEPHDAPRLGRFDVLFVGNCYSPARRELERVLRALPYDVKIVGRGWAHADDDTNGDFARSAAWIKSARIVVGDNQYAGARGFVSNRLFETLARGAFLLHQRVEGLEELLGLKDGVHYVTWDTLDELPALIEHWLKHEKGRERVQANARVWARKHTFDARVDELARLLEENI
jgi:glycosyltransferase involved in cell wall biosynthesis